MYIVRAKRQSEKPFWHNFLSKMKYHCIGTWNPRHQTNEQRKEVYLRWKANASRKGDILEWKFETQDNGNLHFHALVDFPSNWEPDDIMFRLYIKGLHVLPKKVYDEARLIGYITKEATRYREDDQDNVMIPYVAPVAPPLDIRCKSELLWKGYPTPDFIKALKDELEEARLKLDVPLNFYDL